MEIMQKERRLFGLMVGIIVALNALSFIYQDTNNLPSTPVVRSAANFARINTTYGGNTDQLGYIDDENISLLWFLHISDIHLSREPASSDSVFFTKFLNTSYYQIQPFTVISTGDHVTGQRPGDFSSVNSKLLPEFQQYFSVMNASPYATDPNPYRYIEVCGNHDRNVDRDAAVFLNYTLSGQRLGTVQKFFVANLSRGMVQFNCLDSGGPMEAPSIPFCSEGNLDRQDMTEYQIALDSFQAATTKFNFQHHHPLITFGLSTDGQYKSPVALNREYNVDAVFYGHSHMNFYETSGDIVYAMTDRYRDSYGSIDNEDYTANHFKIITVDNNGVNFIDSPLSTSPRVIITNPSNPLFLDKNDPINNTRGDGHIRTLIFEDSTDPVQKVEYRVDEGAWTLMQLYSNSTKLYESARTLNGEPTTAIPDDGKIHKIEVQVTTQSGKIITQIASATSSPDRKPFTNFAFVILGTYYALIVVVMNRDNLPFRRSDGKRRRLNHQEKVTKRQTRNQLLNKPWWLPTLGLALVGSFLFLPWGILPALQSHLGLVYSWGIVNTLGTIFTIETVVFQSVKLLVILPNLYWSIRTYHPNWLQFVCILTLANSLFILQFNVKNFGWIGLWSPGAWFDFIIAGVIIVLQMQNTILGKILTPKKK
jgi:predicted phosphodiesterase